MTGIREEMTEIRARLLGVKGFGTRIPGILGILPKILEKDLAGILIGCNSSPLVIREAAARIQDIIVCLIVMARLVMATTTAMITTSK